MYNSKYIRTFYGMMTKSCYKLYVAGGSPATVESNIHVPVSLAPRHGDTSCPVTGEGMLTCREYLL